MSQVKIIELQTKLNAEGLDKLEKRLDQTENQLKDVEKQSTQTAKATKGIGTAVKGVGTALKALGIGVIIALFAKFTQVLSNNQKVMDFLSNVGTSLNIVFKDLFSIFDNGIPSLDEIGESIKKNLLERFYSAIEVAGFLGQALKRLFEGDFAGALDSAKEAGKEFFDVMTGQDDFLNKAGEYADKIWEQAEATTELANASVLAEASQRRLFEQYDRDAEIQRRLRDDFELTAQQRLDANEKLKEILDEQEKAQLKLGRISVASAQAQQAANGKTVESQRAIIDAMAEMDAIQADIAGRRAEQEAQDRALRKEILDLRRQEIGSVMDLGNLEVENTEEIAEAKIVATADSNEIIRRSDEVLAEARLNTASNLLTALSGLAEEGSAGAKAIAIAQAVISTYQGINKALAETTDFTPTQSLRFANAAAVGIAGFANVANILKQKPSGAITPTLNNSSGNVTANVPAFNVVGTSGSNQLAEALQQDQQPIQAYVVGSNVTTQQELDRNIVDTASLG